MPRLPRRTPAEREAGRADFSAKLEKVCIGSATLDSLEQLCKTFDHDSVTVIYTPGVPDSWCVTLGRTNAYSAGRLVDAIALARQGECS